MTSNFVGQPAFSPHLPFHTTAKVHTPGGARWAGRFLFLLFVFSPAALMLVPWQQTVQGRGQVVAYAPTERKQVVTARVSGQIVAWHVVEGTRVKAGDPIVDIDDNDPGLETRLQKQWQFLQDRLKAANDEVAQQESVVKAQRDALAANVRAAEAKAAAAGENVSVAEATRKNAAVFAEVEEKAFRLVEPLRNMGLEPGVNVLRAEATAERARIDVQRADAAIKNAKATVLQDRASVEGARASGLSAVAAAERSLQQAVGARAAIERDIQELDTRIERFKARKVVAPVSGVVFRISANAGAGGQVVKEGDELCEIVPDATDRVVELFIDGLDAPLVAAHMEQTGRGPHVRLQFEGWPGVQFAGWPAVAIGTFGGRVRQMDPHDDGNGRFRVLVEPEQMFEGDEWPEGLYLRQGNQAIGWVFLNRVTVGYELWRQFNGFPPVIAPTPPAKDKAKEDKKGSKPPKVKPGG